MSIEITNEDNMDLMDRYPDNHFELAICDPPYMSGDNKALQTLGTNRKKYNVDKFIAPDNRYFNELLRVSKNQIIWGGNYFTNFLRSNRCWLMWDKIQDLDQFSDFELAWTSFDKVCKKFTKVSKGGFLTNYTIDHKIHPTQKPIKLYEWLLINYAKEGDKILDTHLGSGSIAIACHNLGFDLTACELDKDYYNDAIKRLDNHRAQIRMF